MNFKGNNELIRIGLRIREMRKQRGLTLDELALRSGLSKGLLSKIENFRTIPSLPVLADISRTLNTDMGELVRGIGTKSKRKYCLVRADKREEVSRDDAVGFLYETVISRQLDTCFLESMVLTIRPGAERREVTSDADQLIFVLKGDIHFRLGSEEIPLHQGDALLFDGRVPHVPLNVSGYTAQLLAIYLLETVE